MENTQNRTISSTMNRSDFDIDREFTCKHVAGAIW